MASPVGYQQFCPVGAALNAVGDRWALLIVRDLMLGPRRYSELLAGLGGVATDILAARLRALKEDGIVRQVGTGRAQRYELTDSGKSLRPVLVELARWGADRLQLPDDSSQVPPRVPLTALLLGAMALPRQANGIYEFRVEGETIRIEVDGGEAQARPDREPVATVTLTAAGLRGLVLGSPTSQIEQSGDVSIEGDRRRAGALLKALSGPPLLDGLRRRFERRSTREQVPDLVGLRPG